MVAFLLPWLPLALGAEPEAVPVPPPADAGDPVPMGDGPVDAGAVPVLVARPSVVVQSEPVVSTGLLSVTVLPGSGGVREGVALDGCVPIELERWDSGTWTRVVARGCVGGETALPVGGRLTLTVPAPTPGRWRVTAGWGARCRPDVPLAFASCEDVGVAVSEAFDVRPPRAR